jgi:hypothetical protein
VAQPAYPSLYQTNDLQSKGLYLDMSAWQTAAFSLTKGS